MNDELRKKVVDADISVEMWKMLEDSFASQSRAKIFQYNFELSNLRKGDCSITDFVTRIKDIIR